MKQKKKKEKTTKILKSSIKLQQTVKFSLLCYSVLLSVLRQYSIENRMINKYGAVCGVRIRRGNQSTSIKPAAMPL
jgi:hypothetical protein